MMLSSETKMVYYYILSRCEITGWDDINYNYIYEEKCVLYVVVYDTATNTETGAYTIGNIPCRDELDIDATPFNDD